MTALGKERSRRFGSFAPISLKNSPDWPFIRSFLSSERSGRPALPAPQCRLSIIAAFRRQ